MNIPTISPQELKICLENSSVLLIDVRDQVEYEQEHIPGAILIPLKILNPQNLPSDTLPIVFHCYGGHRASKACALLLKDQPHRSVKSLKGGLNAWKAAGFPVNKSSKTLSLHRQLFIVAGSFVSIFSVLAIKGSRSSLSILLCLGLGMIFAGTTGICFLARFLKKMPWNKHL